MRTVSVVINNYNYARFLRQAIDSALAQSYAAEVVVVDDGSSDDSVQVIQSYGDKIRPVLKTNGGQGSAFNAGFAAARGDIIVLLDSDDYFSPVAVEHLVSAWKEDTAILYHRLRVVDASGRPRAIRWKQATRRRPSYNTAAFAIRPRRVRSTAGPF